jgi:DNA mismatch endonuclease, patch repair protein
MRRRETLADGSRPSRRIRRSSRDLKQGRVAAMELVTAPTPETSARMRRVRREHTKPELVVRHALWSLGAHYRACVRALPGSPDIANRSKHWAIFVHGCFWHGHAGCALYTTPKSNPAFWQQKVRDNRARDARKRRTLLHLGYRVLVVWQCQTRDERTLNRRLVRFIKAGR